MSDTSDVITSFVLGGIFLLPGVALLAKPRELANANDTKGPAWVRNWNGRAYPGRTKPWAMVLLGFAVTGLALFLVVIGILGATNAINLTN